MTMLTPALALIVWTLIVWGWLFAIRIPAMQKSRFNPQDANNPGALDALPITARMAANNYNHLHEQPTIFYALAIYSHLVGVADPLNIALAWGYVGLRVAHSFTQIVLKQVMLRFYIFLAASVMIIIMAARNVIALLV